MQSLYDTIAACKHVIKHCDTQLAKQLTHYDKLHYEQTKKLNLIQIEQCNIQLAYLGGLKNEA